MKTKKDVIFAAATAVFAVVAVAYTFWGGFNLGATVSCALLLILSTAYMADKQCKPSSFCCICGVLALLASTVYTFSTDAVFRALGAILIPALITIYWIGLGGNGRYWQGSYTLLLDILRTIFTVPFAHLITAMKAVFTKKEPGKYKNLGKILLGLTAAFPVLLIIIPLLMKADLAFSGFILSLVNSFSIWETASEIILGLMIAPFLFAVMYALRNKLDKPEENATAVNPGALAQLSSVAVTSFLSAISFCYLVYLVSQLAYFFDGFSGILPNGWNVVDYAKRGFFEMSVIAAINLAVIFLVSICVRRKTPGEIPLPVKLLNLYISLFTLLLISTAQAKMFMYIRDFGMTRLRLLTSLFMWLLVLIYLCVILRLFLRKFPYMKAIVLAVSLVFFTAWGLAPVRKDLNAMICEYNISIYQERPDRCALDIPYLSTLGSSATPYLIELAESSTLPAELKAQAAEALTVRAEDILHENGDEFKSYNYSKAAEKKLLADWINHHR